MTKPGEFLIRDINVNFASKEVKLLINFLNNILNLQINYNSLEVTSRSETFIFTRFR